MSAYCFRLMSSLAVLVVGFALSARSSAQQQNTDLDGWLLADCEVGQQGVIESQLAQAGAPVVPGLVQAAQNGPDDTLLSQIQLRAGQQFDDITAFLAGGGGTEVGLSAADIQDIQSLTRTDFITQEVNNSVLSYRSRALVGLGIVGGATAVQTLQSFAQDNSSPYLQNVAMIALQQMPSPPDFGISATPSTATVNQGQSSLYTVTVQSQNGFNSPVALSCSGLPSKAACTFGSPTVASGSGTSTLTITTAGPSANLQLPSRSLEWPPLYVTWLPLPALALIGAGLNPRKRKRAKVLLCFLVLGLILVQVRCGGGSNSTPPSNITPGTPPGTYIITITGTSGVQHSATVSLTVH